MKQLSYFKQAALAFAVIVFTLVSCDKDVQEEVVVEEENLEVYSESSLNENEFLDLALNNNEESNFKCAQPSEICGEYKFYPLIASKYYFAGALVVYNDTENLYATFISRVPLTEFHLYIGEKDDMPKTKSGNPKTAHFPYKAESYYGKYFKTFIIPLEDIPECYTLAAHAVFCRHTIWAKSCENSTTFKEAYGAKNWGWIIEDCVEKCEEEEEKYLGLLSCIAYTDINQESWVTLGEGEVPYETEDWCKIFHVIQPKDGDVYELKRMWGFMHIEMDDENLTVKLVAKDHNVEFKWSHLFYGTLEELETYNIDGGCPDYYAFPYEIKEYSKEHTFVIPLK